MQFTIFGDNYRMGSYILLLEVAAPFELAFGRFRKGALQKIPAGTALYIGSALGSPAARGYPLASRLLRHCTRTGKRPLHRIREKLLRFFAEMNGEIGEKKISAQKKLHWHIDYLLDREEVTISGIVMIMSPVRLEEALAEMVCGMEEVSVIAEGLGAQDSRAPAHLLHISGTAKLLRMLPEWVTPLIGSP